MKVNIPLKPKKKLIGITGGIGSGKSTAAKMLYCLGVPVIDLDRISKSLTRAGAKGSTLVLEKFPEFLKNSNEIDREKLRQSIFINRDLRREIELILHPLIQEVGFMEIEKTSITKTGYIAIDIPLLDEESHWREYISKTLVIDCTIEKQIERVKFRDKLQIAEIEAIINAQISRSKRLSISDSVIYNENLSINELKLEIKSWHSLLSCEHSIETERHV